MTVGQLRAALAIYDEALPVYVTSHDTGADYNAVEDLGVEDLDLFETSGSAEEEPPPTRVVCLNRFVL